MAKKRTSSRKQPSTGVGRKRRRKRSSAAEQSSGVESQNLGVTIRMFCQGLGDCFLLSIPQEETRPYFILIDCGVAMGTSGETNLMKQTVSKIAELTKDPATDESTIDLLVVTHEHRDHVSGFIQAADELSGIEFGHVWYAWTEDRQDQLANELRKKHAKEKATLVRAFGIAREFARTGSIAKRRIRALQGVIAFYEAIPMGEGKGMDVSAAMAEAGKLQKNGFPSTLLPGKVLMLPNASSKGMASGVHAYVLGPPHDAVKLRRINPSKKNPETYEKTSDANAALASLGMTWAWSAAMSVHANEHNIGDDSDPNLDIDRAMPFDAKWRRDLKQLARSRDDGFFRRNYFDSDSQRRIDSDWLWSGVQRLALYMENYTNNTSLALAFELPRSKKVLLFAADAQVGNWLSWHDIEFKTDDDRTLNASHLLANTVLYKVGHHGSHNATLREKGLELMTHPELVAMLPVEKIAVERLGYGEMPLLSLLEELGKRAGGRVLHLDQSWPHRSAPGTWPATMVKAKLANDCFRGGANNRPFYMEHTVIDS